MLAYQSSSASLTGETLDSVPAVCFELDPSPPIPVISGAAVSHDDLVLEARDGNRFAAFLATPEEPSATGVVILPDVRGLYRFYEELALRFAERGYPALAFDYFGRTAGVEKRGEEFEYMPHVEAVTPEEIQADVAAAVEHLRSLGVESVFTVGFCMGGRAVLARRRRRARARRRGRLLRPAGRAQTARRGRSSSPRRWTRRCSRCRPAPTRTSRPSDNEAFEQALSDAGVEHELVVYEGAPHSFFDRKQERVRRRLRGRLGARRSSSSSATRVIREARPDEAEALPAIQRDASLAAFAHIFPPELYPYPIDDVPSAGRSRSPTEAEGARRRGGRSRRRRGRAVAAEWLDGLYVLPEWWSRGVGRALHDEVLERLRADGCARCHLWVLEHNDRARRFYERLGWVENGDSRVVPFPPNPIDVGYSIEL